MRRIVLEFISHILYAYYTLGWSYVLVVGFIRYPEASNIANNLADAAGVIVSNQVRF